MKNRSPKRGNRQFGHQRGSECLKGLMEHGYDHIYGEGELFALITEDYLRKSGGLVRQNVGPGKAYKMIKDFLDNGAKTIPRLHADIHAGTYRPDRVFMCEFNDRYSNARNRPEKIRKVAFLTPRDKVIQKAIAEILSAIYDKSFQKMVYGYRPKRGIEDARNNFKVMFWPAKAKVILKIDIAAFFDTIPREELLKVLSLRIADQGIINLIRMWLYAQSIVPTGTVLNETKGITQGSGLAPVLSNIYMDHFFDRWVLGLAQFGVLSAMRYADDIMVACDARESAERAKNLIKERLQDIGLSVSAHKTKLVSLEKLDSRSESVNFLGETFQFSHRPKNQYFQNTKNTKIVRRYVSRATVVKFLRKIQFFLVEKSHSICTETEASRAEILLISNQFASKVKGFAQSCGDSPISVRRKTLCTEWAWRQFERAGLMAALARIEIGRFDNTHDVPHEIREILRIGEKKRADSKEQGRENRRTAVPV